MWFWILIAIGYIIVGIIAAVAYIANYSDPIVRAIKGMPSPAKMKKIEPITMFFLWPLAILGKIITNLIT